MNESEIIEKGKSRNQSAGICEIRLKRRSHSEEPPESQLLEANEIKGDWEDLSIQSDISEIMLSRPSRTRTS